MALHFRRLAILFVSLAFISYAGAATIDFCGSGFNPGSGVASAVLPGGVGTVNSFPRNFSCKSGDGTAGLGVAGGATAGEIDVDEYLRIDFDTTSFSGYEISELKLGYLFNGSEYSDPMEEGLLTVALAGGGTGYIKFRVSGENTLSIFDSFGVGIPGATTICAGTSTTNGGGGCFVLTDPFGGASVTSVKFEAISVTPRPQYRNDSDYVLSSISYVATPPVTEEVPEPSTYALMAFGLISLGLLRKRKPA